MRQAHLQSFGECRRWLDRWQISSEQERAANAGIKRSARIAETQVPSHRLDVDATQRVVDVGVVLVSKFPTIHSARGG